MSWHWLGVIQTKFGNVFAVMSAANALYGLIFARRAGLDRMSSNNTNGLCLLTYSAAFSGYCGPVNPADGIVSMYAAHVSLCASSWSTMFRWSYVFVGRSSLMPQFEPEIAAT